MKKLCCKCGVHAALVEVRGRPYCETCGSALTKELWKWQVVNGGAAVEAPKADLAPGEIEIPFSMNPPAAEQPKVKWCGSELVMRFSNGRATAIRLTQQEQAYLYKWIMDKRRTGSKDLQAVDVMVFDIKTAQRLLSIAERVSEDFEYEDLTVQKFLDSISADAKELLDDMKS